MMRHGGKRHMCRKISGSKPSRRSRSISIRAAHAEGVAPGIVQAMRAMVQTVTSRAGVSALNLPYVVGIQSTPSVWPPRSGAFGLEAVEWPRPTPLQCAARRRTQACLGQRLGSELRQKGMAQRYLAGGIERAACFPLRHRSRAPRRAGLQANHTASGRMAARSNGRRERRLPQNTGFRPCPRTRPSPHLLIMPNCAGASNVITKSSKVNSA